MRYTTDKIKQEISESIPCEFAGIINQIDFDDLREVRFRAGQKMMLYYGTKTLQLGNIVSHQKILEIFESFCKSSVYAYLNEIKNGFLTLAGGHRIGICGECAVKNGEITNIYNISGLNIRIAREYIGCARKIIPYINDNGILKNTIIIAPPACGKTTMLRDIARTLSRTMKVTVVDERDEMCSMCDGVPQFDIGPQTDVYSKAPKALGITMALRSLSPDVIITDEVGTNEDISAILKALGAGCGIVTSIHGYSTDSIKESKGKLLSLFDIAIELKKENGVPKISNIIEMEKTYD
ncbi:MAG: stage III sporulation protein AA [Clostridia bacterium]|nr:stage III sporulation protein AA [Clostridia bacterium]